MDEPTGPLTQQDAARLFSLIRQLRSRGVGIIYISHRLEEIFEVADRLTVLRDGRRIVAMPVGETTREMWIHHMVGRRLTQWIPPPARQTGPPGLRVGGWANPGRLPTA